jgi:3-mercaptopyruvate sulfurtransferase SseA
MAPLTPPQGSGGRRSVASPLTQEIGILPRPGQGSVNQVRASFRLVRAQEVAAKRADPNAAHNLIFLEAHFTSLEHPLNPDRDCAHHLPGAIQIHPSYLESGLKQHKYFPHYDSPRDGNLCGRDKLSALLERLAISPDTHVVVYGTEPDGAMAAARLVWGLLYAGVAKVSLLDGGIEAWMQAGGRTDSRVNTVWDLPPISRQRPVQASRWRFRPELLATSDEVRQVVDGSGDAEALLVDVRRRGEWDGTMRDYYQFYSEAGHIPSAIHQGNWDNLLEPRTQKLGPHLTEIAARWRSLGIIGDHRRSERKTLIFYCGTGWRSSVAFLAARLLGLRCKNYDDGFYGWSSDKTNSVALGESSPT